MEGRDLVGFYRRIGLDYLRITQTMEPFNPNSFDDGEKSNAQIEINSTPDVVFSAHERIQTQKGSTPQDIHDMTRMGKRQQLRRDFRFLSIVGFVMVLQSTWESILLAAQYGLVNGGTAGVIWVTVAVIVGALCMIASIAEMASMLVGFFLLPCVKFKMGMLLERKSD